jgi:hypothetical protein
MADKTARQAADRRGQGEKWLVIDKTKNLISPFNAPSFALFVPFCGYFRTPPSLSVFAALREIFFSFIRVHSRSLFAAIRGYFLRPLQLARHSPAVAGRRLALSRLFLLAAKRITS